jgi:hypothetical protein
LFIGVCGWLQGCACGGPHYYFAGEMGDGPEEEEDGHAAGQGTHKVDAAGGGVRVIPEEDDEEATHQGEERGARGVGDLEFKTAGNEFTAIPEATGRLHGHDVYGCCEEAYDPPGDIVDLVEAHGGFFYFWARIKAK